MSQVPLSVAEKIRVLSICSVFARVPPASLGTLAEMMEMERLDAAEVLFEQGEPPERIYVVASGRLKVFVPGRPEPVRTLGAGELLGEYGMFSEHGRTATVKAEIAAVLLSLDYQRFRTFLLQFPETMLVLLKTAVQRLVESEAKGDGGPPTSGAHWSKI